MGELRKRDSEGAEETFWGDGYVILKVVMVYFI